MKTAANRSQRSPQRTGRKPRVAKPGERLALGLKVTPEIKNRLDAAARANGRTQSQEAEARIEQTFRGSEYLDQAMELAYGRRGAALLAIIGRAINEIGRMAPFPTDWMNSPRFFDEVAAAVAEIFHAFRPDGAGPPHPIVAPGVVRPLLAAVQNPNEPALASWLTADLDPTWADELKDWATPLHKKLGPIAARVRIQEGPAEHMRHVRGEGQ